MHSISKIILLIGLILVSIGAPMWAKGVSDKLIGCVDGTPDQDCASKANMALKWAQPMTVLGSMIVGLGLIGILVSCLMYGSSHFGGRGKSPMNF